MSSVEEAISKRKSAFFWLFVVCLLLLEFFLFKNYVNREIVDFYPRGTDQTQFLPLAYHAYQTIQQYGIVSGIAQTRPLATGLLFPIQAAIFFLLVGASRWSCLLINFIYFVALQACCLWTMKGINPNRCFPVFFLGILLAINTPYFNVGSGLFDVRMDCIAFCLYGIFVCLTIKSNFFLHRQWSVVTAVIICLTILLRTITFIYFVGVIGSLLAYFLMKRWKANNHRALLNQQIINLLSVCVLIATVTIPCVWWNRTALYNYYVMNHVLGEEKYIRAIEAGVTSPLSALLYYPDRLLFLHLDWLALSFSLAMLLFYTFIYMQARKQNALTTVMDVQKTDWRTGSVFLLLAIFIPMIALTLDMSKSSVVGSIMVVPTIWLVFWYCLYVDARVTLTAYYQNVLHVSAYCILFMAILKMAHMLHSHLSKWALNNLTTISQMYLDIGDYAVAKKWLVLSTSFDQLSEHLTPGGIAALYYEKRGKLLSISGQSLGTSIYAINAAQALASLQASNVVILNLGKCLNCSQFYPFNQTVEKLKPLLQKYAEQHFVRLGDYHFLDSTYRVYVAPS